MKAYQAFFIAYACAATVYCISFYFGAVMRIRRIQGLPKGEKDIVSDIIVWSMVFAFWWLFLLGEIADMWTERKRK